MARDLVCHMDVDENHPDTPRYRYQGLTYYFCTPLCMTQFQADPDRYIRNQHTAEPRIHKGKGNPSSLPDE